jgi:hypothetical protein
MRYVVLHHEGYGEPHYDLMFESAPGSLLMTWRAKDWPVSAGDILTRIGDHRRKYLEYEGPVSNNRGRVIRVASGDAEVAATASQITFQLITPHPSLILLRNVGDDSWRVVEIENPGE